MCDGEGGNLGRDLRGRPRVVGNESPESQFMNIRGEVTCGYQVSVPALEGGREERRESRSQRVPASA